MRGCVPVELVGKGQPAPPPTATPRHAPPQPPLAPAPARTATASPEAHPPRNRTPAIAPPASQPQPRSHVRCRPVSPCPRQYYIPDHVTRPPHTIRRHHAPHGLTSCGFVLYADRATDEASPFHLHRDWGQSAEMRPVVSERYGRFASRVEGFCGWRAPSAGLSGGWSSRRVGGSAATPTQCGLIAAGRMPTDRSSTAWPNGYVRQRNRSVKPWSPCAVRGRRSEQNWRIACDCRHLQPRPGPNHHGLAEQLRPP